MNDFRDHIPVNVLAAKVGVTNSTIFYHTKKKRIAEPVTWVLGRRLYSPDEVKVIIEWFQESRRLLPRV